MNFKKISLVGKYGGGGYVKVNKADYPELSRYVWWSTKAGYAYRQENGKNIYMHQYLCRTKKGMTTDHINNNKRDNRRENLRVCIRRNNLINKGLQSNNTSGYRGVYWVKANRNWRAEITYNEKHIHIGTFANILDAASAYDKVAKRLFGKYARLNMAKETKPTIKDQCDELIRGVESFQMSLKGVPDFNQPELDF